MQQITYAKHPLLPLADREQYTYETNLEDNTLLSVLKTLPYDTDNLDVHAFVGETLVPRSEWGTYKLPEGENNIVLKQRLHGGDDSNPLVAILMIVLIIVTYGYAAPWAAAAFGGTEAAWAAVIVVAGTALINAIFPPVLPKFDADAKESPTYTLSGTRNRARAYGPLPLLVGTHRMAPDLGAKPFTSQTAKDVFLHQVFNFGYGDLVISDEKIGDALIANHQELIQEFSTGGTGALDLFPTNVDSISGGEIRFDDGFTIRTSSINTTQLTVDFTGSVFRTTDEGKIAAYTVPVVIQYRAVGDVTWIDFSAGADGTRGRGNGGRGRGSNSGGTSYGAGVFPITSASTKPVRVSYSQRVDLGQYEVQVARTQKESDDTKIQDSVNWQQLRSFQPDTGDYTGQTRMALQVRASGQFSGVVDSYSAVVSARIPVWDGVSSYNTEISSNPAMIFLYLARGAFDGNGKAIFGAGLPDVQIDLAGIYEWQAWCDLHSLECNFVFDRKFTVAEMLTLVCRAGRASPTWQTGVLGVVYDEENKPPVQQFGMQNIMSGSFGVQYVTEKLADQVTVKFLNRDLDWQPDEVTVNVPNVTNPTAPIEIELAGITSVAQAEREANLLAARQFYHKRRVTFETDIEGFVCGRGDVITLSHDLTNWGQSGRLISGTDTILVLDRPVTFENGTTYYISVRHPDLTFETKTVVNPSVGPDVITNIITLTAPLSMSPDADINNEPMDYIYAFDPNPTPGFKLKVVNIEATEDNRIRIACIDERDEYYAHETDPTAYTPPTRYNTVPAEVTNFTVTEEWQGVENPLILHLDWDLHNATGTTLSVQRNNEEWVNYGPTIASEYTLVLDRYQDGDVINMELAPTRLGLSNDAQVILSVSYVLEGLEGARTDITVPTITGLELFGEGNGTLESNGAHVFGGKEAKFVWRKQGGDAVPEFGGETAGAEQGSIDQFFLDYEVIITDEVGVVRRTEYVKDEAYVYTLEKNKEDGNGVAIRTFRCLVRMRTTTNQTSEIAARLLVTNPAPAAPSGLTVKTDFQTIYVQADEPSDIDFAGIIVHVDTAVLPGTPLPGDSTLAIRTTGTSAAVSSTVALASFAYATIYHVRAAFFDDFGDTTINFSADTVITPIRINGALLEDGIIDVAKHAAGLRPIQIVGVLPTLPAALYPNGSVVFLTTNNKLYRSTGTTWTVATDGADITANSITAGQIQAGAISTDELAANAITTEKLAVVSFGMALNSDPYFGDEGLTGQWFANYTGTPTLSTDTEFDVISAAGGVGPLGVGNVLRGQALNTGADQFFSAAMPVDPNKVYRVKTYAKQTGATFKNYLLVTFFDAAGTIISSGTTDAIGWTSIGTHHYWQISNTVFAGTWTQYTQTFGGAAATTIPSNAVSMRVGSLTLRNIVTPSNQKVYFYEYTVEEVIPTALIQDGAITANKILANSITADQIATNAITTVELAADAVEAVNIKADAVTADKLAVNSITAANGSIADLAVTTGKIDNLSVTTLKIANAAVTNIAAASTGSQGVPTYFTGSTGGSFPQGSGVAWTTILTVPITIDTTASDILVQGTFTVTVESGLAYGGSVATRGSEWCGCSLWRSSGGGVTPVVQLWSGGFDIGRHSSAGFGWTKDYAQEYTTGAVKLAGIAGSYNFYLRIFGTVQGGVSVPGVSGPQFYHYQNTLIVTEIKR